MSIRQLLATGAAALLGTVALAAPAFADVPVQQTGAYTPTAGRLWSLVGALLAVAGVVVGGFALARSGGRLGSRTRRDSIAAVAAGGIGTLIGSLVVMAARGGPGTGYGIVGGYIALAIGLIALALGGLALINYRRVR